MTKPPAPNPNGPPPDNWETADWDAYQIWATGGTRHEAALNSGLSKTTISRRSRHWQDTYNTDNINIRPVGLTPEAQAAGSQAGVEARQIEWLARRHDLQTQVGATATKLAALVETSVDKLATRINNGDLVLDPKETRALTLALKDYVAAADRLALEPGATEGPVITLNFGELPDTVTAAINAIDSIDPEPDIIDIQLAEEA